MRADTEDGLRSHLVRRTGAAMRLRDLAGVTVGLCSTLLVMANLVMASPAAPQGEADWKQDFPGRVHRIDLKKLPKPYDTKPAVNFPKLIERPADARLQ